MEVAQGCAGHGAKHANAMNADDEPEKENNFYFFCPCLSVFICG
jgi:hypothetical protein